MSHLNANQMLDTMRKLYDEQRIAQPWIHWARRNPVHLQLSDYAEPSTAYVMKQQMEPGYMVVAHPLFIRAARRALPDSVTFPLRDQELAEMIAWHSLEGQP